MCEGDCGERPCPLRGPAPPPAGTLPPPPPAGPVAPGGTAGCPLRVWGCGGLQPSGFPPPFPPHVPIPFPCLLASRAFVKHQNLDDGKIESRIRWSATDVSLQPLLSRTAVAYK
ncbi:hypothetical protein Q9966_005511 [Columba livia]|nr:hypothetical protein Q9966_005511 [Columba livia]